MVPAPRARPRAQFTLLVGISLRGARGHRALERTSSVERDANRWRMFYRL